jgi:hypothetical protein
VVEKRLSYDDSFFSPAEDKLKTDQFNLGLRTGSSWLEFPDWLQRAKQRHSGTKKVIYFLRHGKGTHNQAEDDLGTQRWEAVEAKTDKFEDAELNDLYVHWILFLQFV